MKCFDFYNVSILDVLIKSCPIKSYLNRFEINLVRAKNSEVFELTCKYRVYKKTETKILLNTLKLK